MSAVGTGASDQGRQDHRKAAAERDAASGEATNGNIGDAPASEFERREMNIAGGGALVK